MSDKNIQEVVPKEETLSEDKLKIADEVLETIAGIEASTVSGVSSLSGGFADGLAGILGKKNLGKGVRVETVDNLVKIYISAIVEYGTRIHLVAKDIQKSVRKSIEEMTGMSVSEVNVSVLGVSIPKEKTDEAEESPEEAEEI